ncbi:MAG: SpoIIE family protein phosphatase [bacterium]
MKCDVCNHDNAESTLYCEKCGSHLYKSKLRIIHHDGLNKTYYLFSKNYEIGRSRNNDIVIPDASVSRHHAGLTYEQGVFLIQDKNSKNGSFLNNLQFKKSRLQNHDCIQLGNVVLHYYSDQQLLPATSNFDTIEFVQKEYFKLAENRQTNVTTTDVLNTMLDLALSLVHADQAAILKYDPSGKLELKIGKNFDSCLIESEQALFETIFASKKPHITPMQPNGELTTTWRSSGSEFSWDRIVFPLLATKGDEQIKDELGHNGLLGLCYLAHQKKHNPISNRKKELLTALMQQMALAIENEWLYDESYENKRMRDEITSAKIVQQKLLPTTHPDIEELEIVSFVEPCETISGDYFDIISVADDMLALAIGDICGKGVPAALLSSTTQAAIRSQLEYSTSPHQIVQNLNRLLIQSTTNSIFLTLFFGILNLETSEFKYINAGHLPPILIARDRKLRELSGTTPPLGILEHGIVAERTVQFEPNDLLLMYTDGLIESQNPRKQIYGRQRFTQLVRTILKNPGKIELDTVVNSIKEDFLAFVDQSKRTDDLTLLAVKRN